MHFHKKDSLTQYYLNRLQVPYYVDGYQIDDLDQLNAFNDYVSEIQATKHVYQFNNKGEFKETYVWLIFHMKLDQLQHDQVFKQLHAYIENCQIQPLIDFQKLGIMHDVNHFDLSRILLQNEFKLHYLKGHRNKFILLDDEDQLYYVVYCMHGRYNLAIRDVTSQLDDLNSFKLPKQGNHFKFAVFDTTYVERLLNVLSFTYHDYGYAFQDNHHLFLENLKYYKSYGLMMLVFISILMVMIFILLLIHYPPTVVK